MNNWAPKYSFITTPSEWNLFYSLISKKIIKPFNDNQLDFDINLNTNSADANDLLTLPIPYVNELNIHADMWGNLTKKLLKENRIKKINNLYLRSDYLYTDIKDWMDAFIESAQKTTSAIKLSQMRMDSDSLSNLFSKLNQTHSYLEVSLSKHSLMIIVFIFESS